MEHKSGRPHLFLIHVLTWLKQNHRARHLWVTALSFPENRERTEYAIAHQINLRKSFIFQCRESKHSNNNIILMNSTTIHLPRTFPCKLFVLAHFFGAAICPKWIKYRFNATNGTDFKSNCSRVRGCVYVRPCICAAWMANETKDLQLVTAFVLRVWQNH